jgi:hypothetical protein
MCFLCRLLLKFIIIRIRTGICIGKKVHGGEQTIKIEVNTCESAKLKTNEKSSDIRIIQYEWKQQKQRVGLTFG